MDRVVSFRGKIIYVAGPYRSSTEEGRRANIAAASAAAKELWERGFAVICPHTNTGGLEQPEDVILKGHRELVRRSDAVFLCCGLDALLASSGTLAELVVAKDSNIPIFCDTASLHSHFVCGE
jgi:hypothetical protein